MALGLYKSSTKGLSGFVEGVSAVIHVMWEPQNLPLLFPIFVVHIAVVQGLLFCLFQRELKVSGLGLDHGPC